jgi:formamidopyrimidine-DNA glycosylase
VIQRNQQKRRVFHDQQARLFGVGNGCLQDILWNARLHPRRPVAGLSEAEKRALYDSTCSVLQEMTALGGRSSKRDLYNNPGGYQAILSAASSGAPCPRCGSSIEKIQYLGGASYFCPDCQK